MLSVIASCHLTNLYASNTLTRKAMQNYHGQRCVVLSKVAGGPRRSQRPCTAAAGRAAGAEPEAKLHPLLILNVLVYLF